MRLEVRPASSELETRPDVVGYTSVLLAREERRLLALIDADVPDDTARERYEQRVRRYLRQLESAVYDRTDRLLPLRGIRPFRVSVHNRNDLLVQGAQLTIRLHVHGQQQLIQADLDEALLTELPDPPEVPDGARLRPDVEVSTSTRVDERRTARRVELTEQAAQSPDARHHGLHNVVEPDNVVATSTGDRFIDLVYPEFDLRPEQVVQTPGVALDLLESVNVRCEATWTVTARNQPGILTGRFELFTVADPYALARTWPADRLPNRHDRTGHERSTAEGDASLGVVGRVPRVCATLDDVNPLLLAAAGELPSTKLRLRLRNATEEIGGLDDQVLDDDPQAAVERLAAKYRVPDTVYRGDPVVVGAPRQRRQEVRDFPHPTRMVTKTLLDYTVAVDFDGDTDLVRASLALCHHEPRWQVHGGQIRAVFTVDPATPAAEVERRIRERATDAATHLASARTGVDHYHQDLNAVVEDLVAKMVAIRLAGQQQRNELTLQFVEPGGEQPAGPQPREALAGTVSADDTDPDLLFRQVLHVLQPAATELAANTPFVEALDSEDLLRSMLVIFLKGRLPEPYLFTEETFHGQGKVDIAVHWHGRLIGVIECKVWHSERKFRDGIDQVLSYLTYEDTRAAYVVFIRQQNVTPIIATLKRAMLGHDNCADTEIPAGTGQVDFAFHATGDPARRITMALVPMPLATSATGTSTERGLRRQRATTDERAPSPG